MIRLSVNGWWYQNPDIGLLPVSSTCGMRLRELTSPLLASPLIVASAWTSVSVLTLEFTALSVVRMLVEGLT